MQCKVATSSDCRRRKQIVRLSQTQEAIRLEAIAIRLEAIAMRLEANKKLLL